MEWNDFFTYVTQGMIVGFLLLILYAFFLLVREGVKTDGTNL